ncbi:MULTISPECIES: TauD/TfdA family dioxygenase [unclassified Crossiella]|uniref:TauD/TfdA family dioxygenase n=1 Tax=unclassified Crossiella TaxID=2620835 RepID=UPI001FFE2FDD|nr:MULTISPECIES: TauD/TfdA family dioxygenase [unclassified Crossiella]MCK2239004.1 TauD/TfdA family dioxygenase [Crossiella sp. S99.2]MCK2251427.1 TauD/TfdA family dioxygenase [Crossiella sp. S99.1]
MTTLGIVPQRHDVNAVTEARTALATDGAVLLTGLPATADALVVAAASVLGPRLRRLFPLRERPSQDGGPVDLHADSFNLVVDLAGIPTPRRDPDEDFVFVQCVQPAPSGGDSFLADAYCFVDEHAEPELREFLTTVDVDLYGKWGAIRGVPALPRVARHVEYTRTGRRIVRRTDGAVPLHRDPGAEHADRMLAAFTEAVQQIQPGLPRFRPTAGEILVVDNYRCWHGRDPHPGDRLVRILTVRTADAR